MIARLTIALALGLLIAAGGNQMLFAQGFSVAPGPGDQQPQAHPCQRDFNALRDDLQGKGQALQAAGKRKATPKELCSRVSGYAAAESKMMQFLTSKAQECGIPPQIADGLKKNQQKTADLKQRICSAAANPGPAAPPPSAGLSGALNQNTGAIPETPQGGGIFDTLSGNILQQ